MDYQTNQNIDPYGVLPKNYSVAETIAGSILLNLVETLLLSGILIFFVCQIPFIFRLKVTLCVLIFAFIFGFEIKGIHSYSLLTALYMKTAWKRNARAYHLTPIDKKNIESGLPKQSEPSLTFKNVSRKELKERVEIIAKDIIKR